MPKNDKQPLRVSDLSTKSGNAFDIRPNAEDTKEIAQELGLDDLRKLRFHGEISVESKMDWRLNGTLGATLTQPCVVTLEAVTTRIDAPVTRLFVNDWAPPSGPEEEMPEDDTLEQLGNHIDLWIIMLEALAINIPLYPRSAGADVGKISVTEPGKTPMTDEEAKPFAGLAALKDKLAKD